MTKINMANDKIIFERILKFENNIINLPLLMFLKVEKNNMIRSGFKTFNRVQSQGGASWLTAGPPQAD